VKAATTSLRGDEQISRLVTRDGTVKLLDFGIAKLLDPEQADNEYTRTEMRRPLHPARRLQIQAA
jgi:hypothetical protein